MMRQRFAILAVILSLASPLTQAQTAYVDPWDPATEAAAEAAVTRLGPQRGLEIRGSVLTIPGLMASSRSR